MEGAQIRLMTREGTTNVYICTTSGSPIALCDEKIMIMWKCARFRGCDTGEQVTTVGRRAVKAACDKTAGIKPAPTHPKPSGLQLPQEVKLYLNDHLTMPAGVSIVQGADGTLTVDVTHVPMERQKSFQDDITACLQQQIAQRVLNAAGITSVSVKNKNEQWSTPIQPSADDDTLARVPSEPPANPGRTWQKKTPPSPLEKKNHVDAYTSFMQQVTALLQSGVNSTFIINAKCKLHLANEIDTRSFEATGRILRIDIETYRTQKAPELETARLSNQNIEILEGILQNVESIKNMCKTHGVTRLEIHRYPIVKQGRKREPTVHTYEIQ